MRVLIYITALAFIAYFFLKIYFDKQKSFSEYLVPELEKNGFKLKSSTYYNTKFMDIPFDDLNEDISINPMGARFAITRVHIQRHLRKVIFLNNNGQLFEAIASIEFKDDRSKTFKRVRWKPELSSFQHYPTKSNS